MVKIQVVGPGCAKCEKLAESARQAATELGLEFTLEKVTDLQVMLRLGIMATPALVVDGRVVLVGKAANAEFVKPLLAPSGPGGAGPAR